MQKKENVKTINIVTITLVVIAIVAAALLIMMFILPKFNEELIEKIEDIASQITNYASTTETEEYTWDISADDGVSNVTATLSSDRVLNIYGNGEMKDYSYTKNTPWYSVRTLIKQVAISEGVTSIGNYVFYKCSSLQEITLPSGITSIGDSAFGNCYSLQEITLPSGITSIGGWAFNECSSLQQITIPEGVTSIGAYVFGRCSSLQEITIPSSVTSIGDYALADISALEKITILGKEISFGEAVLGYDNYNICGDIIAGACVRGSTAELIFQAYEIPYEIINLLTSTEQKIDEINLKITNIKPNTTVEQIRETLKSDISYQIKNIEGNIIEETSNVGTGYKLELENGDVYTLIVTGDLNGDGQVKPSDLSKLKLNLVGSQTLQGAYAEAADLNGDGQIKPSDLSKLKLYLVGKGSL